MSKVAILGSGPAGLLAAHACVESGVEPVIYSRPGKSKMFGAMYLHRAIPRLTPLSPELEIDLIKSGTREGYAETVYGDPNADCSWDKIVGETICAWDLTKAYDELWARFGGSVIHDDINAGNVRRIIESYNYVMSSIPANALCIEHHEFTSNMVWIQHGPGKDLIPGVNDGNMMYYNGVLRREGGHHWYRFSQINGYQAWEFSTPPVVASMPDWHTLDTGVKIVGNNCDCWEGLIIPIGRFGEWRKGVLTHHAYEKALMTCALL